MADGRWPVGLYSMLVGWRVGGMSLLSDSRWFDERIGCRLSQMDRGVVRWIVGPVGSRDWYCHLWGPVGWTRKSRFPPPRSSSLSQIPLLDKHPKVSSVTSESLGWCYFALKAGGYVVVNWLNDLPVG